MSRRPSLVQGAPKPDEPTDIVPTPPAKGKGVREGKRGVVFWVSREAYQELQVATKRMDTTIQAAGEEMLAEWFRRHAVKAPPL